MMVVQKNDFVEIDFIAKANGEVFDTNLKEEAKKAGLQQQSIPLIIAVGRNMVIKGLDKDLEGKEINKQYSSKFTPEEAFGKRDSKMIKMIPLKVFHEHKINPQAGMPLSLDGMLVKILSVSGGRVLVDFNNPLAGKEVQYDYTIKRKIEDIKEKVNALQDFFFRTKFEFDADSDITFKVDENTGKFIQLFEKQFEEILGKKIKFAPKEEKKEEKVEDKPSAEQKNN